MMTYKPLDLILLNVGFANHQADWNFEQIKSPFARIYYVTQGVATVAMGGETHTLTPGRLYLIPPFAMHTDRCDGLFSLYYLHVYQWVANGLGVFETFDFPFSVDALPIDALLVERLLAINPLRELRQYDPKWYDNMPMLLESIAQTAHQPIGNLLETQGVLQMLMARFVERAHPKMLSADRRLVDAVLYVNEHLGDTISVADLAGKCCLSVDHFIRLFKREIGCTPMSYVNAKRIERAQSLLAFTNSTVADVAFELAFSTVPHFCRIFKKLVGQTPVEYRRMVRLV